MLRLVVAWCLAASLGCQAGDDDGPVLYGEPVLAPRDDEITVLPVPGIDSSAFDILDPVAVGFEFDGVVRPDGQVVGYLLDGQLYEPTIRLVFAGEAYFRPTSEEESDVRSHCIAIGWWDAGDDGFPATLDAPQGVAFHAAYEGRWVLEAHDCHGLLDPQEYGEDAVGLLEPFDGMRLGLGFSPLSEAGEEAWPDGTLARWGSSMLSTYVALADPAGGFAAQELSTTFAIAIDSRTGELSQTESGLIALDVASESTTTPLPAFYAFTIATWFLELSSIDLTALK